MLDRVGGRMQQEEADEALMHRIALGDQRALRILMGRYMARVVRLAEGVLGSAAESDDVAQETFLRVWHNAAIFDPAVAKFTTWLHRIALNLAIDRSRRPRGNPIEDAEHATTDESGALGDLIENQEENVVAQCILQLPERQRAALTLFHFEGLSGRDAAAAMSMSDKAFESLLTRARAALKERFVRAQAPPPGRRP
jgi:RNA polymerase sigma-70 factor (ECF subfamily)